MVKYPRQHYRPVNLLKSRIGLGPVRVQDVGLRPKAQHQGLFRTQNPVPGFGTWWKWPRGGRIEESEIDLSNWILYWGMTLPCKVWHSTEADRITAAGRIIVYIWWERLQEEIRAYTSLVSLKSSHFPYQQVGWVFMAALITKGRGRHPVIPLSSVIEPTVWTGIWYIQV